MRKALLGLLGLCGYSICCVAQSGLYLTSGTDIFISPATIFSVDSLALTPSSAFSITSPNSLTRNAAIVHTAPQRHIFRVFHFSNTTNVYNGDVAFYYLDDELNTIAESALTLNFHSGSIWRFAAPDIRDAAINVVVTNGLTGTTLSELTLAHMMTPLPVNWGPIHAQRQQADALVKWNTSTESSIAFFQVERSLDGINWKATGNPVKAFNTPGKHQYELLDATVSSAQTFYRIQQVAIDGRFNYSAVVAVTALNNNNGILVYPNPTTNWATIQAAPQLITTLKLYDATGRMVRHEKLSTVSTYSLDLSGLPKGAYQLELIFTNGHTEQQQILKQ